MPWLHSYSLELEWSTMAVKPEVLLSGTYNCCPGHSNGDRRWHYSVSPAYGFLIPEATSWMYEAICVKFASRRLTPMSPSKGCTSGGGGGTTIRELALRAMLSHSPRGDFSNRVSNRVTYCLAPCICVRACRNSIHMGSTGDPSLMYSSLQLSKKSN